MSYISILIALFKTKDALVGAAWWDKFLDNLVVVETWFYHAAWVIWGIIILVAVLIGLYAWLTRTSLEGCGCSLAFFAFFGFLLPLWEWITLSLATGMANAVNPEGVVNQGQLILNAVLYLILGTG